MLDSFGGALRRLREQRGWSLRALGRHTSMSFTYLCNVEAGRKPPTVDVARVCDEAFGTAPLFQVLFEIEEGDPMRRRTLLGGGFAAVAGTMLATADGTAALAACLTDGLAAAAGQTRDWDALAADFARRHLLAPGPQLGHEIAAHLAVAEHAVTAGDTDAARGAALLALTYGLWLGDLDRIPTAHGLYATSAALADRSGDNHTRALVRARAANRGLYEGWTAERALAAAGQALAISGSGPAALEAHAARVHVAGLTGDNPAGRAAVRAMYEAAGDEHGHRRAVSFDCYLTCRTGTLRDAQAAYARARTELAPVPLWLADATLYWARALVAAGDVGAGLAAALGAVRGADTPVRVLGWGVRDVLSVLPAQRRSDDAQVLAGYAARGPAPWETVS